MKPPLVWIWAYFYSHLYTCNVCKCHSFCLGAFRSNWTIYESFNSTAFETGKMFHPNVTESSIYRLKITPSECFWLIIRFQICCHLLTADIYVESNKCSKSSLGYLSWQFYKKTIRWMSVYTFIDIDFAGIHELTLLSLFVAYRIVSLFCFDHLLSICYNSILFGLVFPSHRANWIICKLISVLFRVPNSIEIMIKANKCRECWKITTNKIET